MASRGLPFRIAALPIVAATLIVAAACGSGDAPQDVPPTPTATPVSVSTPTLQPAPAEVRQNSSPQSLAQGEFRIPAAAGFGDPGFHAALVATHDLPADVDQTGGLRLVLRLWDAARPGQTCSREHPLSGCATVDWSDFEGRPNVPTGGVFDNRIVVQLESGPLTLYLTEDGELVDEPNQYDPG